MSPTASVEQPTLPGFEQRTSPWDRVRGVDRAWWLLAGLMILFFAGYGPDVYRRQQNFSSFSWDMGIFDQAVWVLSRFHSFITVRGLNFFGHHASPAMFVFVPFYWLGAGAHFINLVQVGSMALGAVPVFLLARDRLEDRWMAVALAAVFLLHPALGFMGWELFHPEVMAITPLLFAYWFATRHRWNWYAASCIVAVAWKEDVALAILVLGLIVAIRGNRRVGLTTAVVAAVYYLLVTRVMLPLVTGETFYEQLYQGIGGSPGHIISNAIHDPSNITRRLSNQEAKHYLWQLVAPFGPATLAAPGVGVIALPQLLANLLSDYVWTRTIQVHYAAVPVAGLTLAAVEGIALVPFRAARQLLVVAAVSCAVLGATSWGLSPIGEQHDRGYWSYDPSRLAVKRQALALIPSGESVSASYLLVPHLSHRRAIYEFPNPLKTRSWGIRDKHPHDPAKLRWIVVDTQTVSAEDLEPLNRVLADGEFRVRFDRQGITVAERIRPPPAAG